MSRNSSDIFRNKEFEGKTAAQKNKIAGTAVKTLEAKSQSRGRD